MKTILLASLSVVTTVAAGVMPPVIMFDRPATKWSAEALPLGNGRIGCMIFGGVDREHIQFNESSLWTGDANPSGDYKTMGAYQNFGDLFIELDRAATGKVAVAKSSSKPGTMTVTAGSKHKPFFPTEGIAFSHDNNPKTKWCVEHDNQPVIWLLNLLEPTALQSYYLTSCSDLPQRDPRTWTLEGSLDGQTWTRLDTRENQEPFAKRGETKNFTFANAKDWRWYRLSFLTNNGAKHFQIAEIGLPGLNPQPADMVEAVVLPERYSRELDLSQALHRLSYRQHGVSFRREAFAGHLDEVMVFRFMADKPGAHSGRIELKGAHGETTKGAGQDLMFEGKFENGLEYQAQVRVVNRGGTVKVVDGVVQFERCDELLLLLAAGTSYFTDDRKNWRTDHPRAKLVAQLESATTHSYDDLLHRHVKDYQRLFNRVKLEIGSTAITQLVKPMPQRLADYAKDGLDPELETLLFQYGRYLLISCSRLNGLPANLQGLWNDSNNPPWHCDYHSNINLQMNYWLAEPANLPECVWPFINLVLAMREPSRQATKAAFGNVRGWTARTSHNIFGGHGWQWNIPSSAWYALHFWEHFAFSGDQKYLLDAGYPMIKEVCQFWEDHLKELPDKRLVAPNGWSPEHGPREDGVAHDQQIVWDLFNNYIEAAKALDTDADYRQRITDLRDRLVGPKIGKWGQLQEWMEDRDDPKDQHRHTSHLFAVYPGRQISLTKTPEFARAAGVSLAARGESGDSRRSWTWPWRCALWARFEQPENAYRMVRSLLTYNVLPNLFGNHPPMQMDGNFGITGAMCEMLVQSHAGEVVILPALPKAWGNGSFTGIRARGGFEVAVGWGQGKLQSATIDSWMGQDLNLRTPIPVKSVQTGAGKTIIYKVEGKNTRFATAKGEKYVLNF